MAPPSPQPAPYNPYPAQGEDQTGPVADNNAPGDNATFQTFYDNLGNLGSWIQTNDYGYVWQPNVNDPNWAPYTEGHWVYTSDGWTWASDEPWGWATYHYGRWVNLDQIGWCWVPGYTWAPAWVSWRYGGGYCGWAPLPPDSFVGIDYQSENYSITVGFHIGGDCDSFYGIGAGCYNFIPVNCLGYPRYHGCYLNRSNNYAVVNQTTNVTSINVGREGGYHRQGGGENPAFAGNFRHVTTGGPSLAQVNAVSPTPIQQVNLVRAHQPGGGTVSNNTLALYAPRVRSENAGSVRPTNVTQNIDHAMINRGVDVSRPLAVNPHLAPAPPTDNEIRRAMTAQNNAPVHARTITSENDVRPVLQAPLTSLQPSGSPARTQSIQLGNVPPTSTPNALPNVNQQPHTYFNNGGEGNTPRVYEPHAVYTPTVPGAYQQHQAPANPNIEVHRPQTYSAVPVVNRPQVEPAVPSAPQTYTPRQQPPQNPTPVTPTAPTYSPSPSPSGGGQGGGSTPSHNQRNQ